MKKKASIGTYILLLYSLSIIYLSMPTANAQSCDYDPLCAPLTQECGCGGLMKRYTLCEGGCAPWGACNVTDTEEACTDNVDNDCDNNIDCHGRRLFP